MKFKLIAIIEISIILFAVLGFGVYYLANNYIKENNSLKQQITTLQENVSNLNLEKNKIIEERDILKQENFNYEGEIEQYQFTINLLDEEIKEKEYKIEELQGNIKVISDLYDEVRPYLDRVQQGQVLKMMYQLLSDYKDYTEPIALNINSLSEPETTNDDYEIWERAKNTYNWLSDNYEYCGDKGLRVGNTFYQFQFYSPDELLMSDNARCGDCDDYATLFAGLMYASGVPEDKVWVVCGTVSSGGHCWNWVRIGEKTYRVDPVCSGKKELFNLFGITYDSQSTPFTDNFQNIDCLSDYNAQMRMNPSVYYDMD